MNRRRFLRASAAAAAGLLGAPALLAQGRGERRMDQPSGVASGDVAGSASDARAIVWSQADRASRMMVEWWAEVSFQNVNRMTGPAAMDVTDYTTRVDLTGLPLGQRIFYRIWYEDL